jgi:membrane fusion protein, multidrug efflux system
MPMNLPSFVVRSQAFRRLSLSWLTLTALGVTPALWAQAPPPPKVEYQLMAPTEIREWRDFSAQLTATDAVQIRPQVAGRIEKVLFSEGDWVKKGQVLFVIDPRPYEAAHKMAKAVLTNAKAKAYLTGEELRRSRQLLDSKLISQSIFDASLADDQMAQAAILQAESGLTKATLDLDYANIQAPIAGQVGRAELTPGNLVNAGPGAPVLTTLVSQTPLYAEFRVDEQTYLAFLKGITQPKEMPVQLRLNQAHQEVFNGQLYALDNQLDPTSGTIRARALIENPDKRLLPGMYAHLQLGSAKQEAALLLPEKAIGTNQDKKFVYVLDDQNTVQYRPVTLGAQHQSNRIILEGLKAGERVVVNGLSYIRPKVTVDPSLAQPALTPLAAE